MAVAMGMYVSVSSGRDRTSEFVAIADRLRKSSSATSSLAVSVSSYGSPPYGNGTNGGAYHAAGDSETARLFSSSGASSTSAASEFNKRASQIGLGIHQTSQKLSKLAKLTKRTSMFDDPAVEIQELTSVIRQDITALNSAISDIQVLCDSRNDGANRSQQSSEHSSTVVKTLKNRLMDATQEFKDVLTLRTENLKGYESRRQIFTVSPAKGQSNAFTRKGSLASAAPSTSIASSIAPPPWGNGSTTSSELFSSSCRRRHTADGSDNLQIQGQGQQQQQQLQHRVPVQNSYMQNRAQALHNVESTITELSSIFTQLSTMVSHQGEVALRIDENMDDSLANVEGAQGQLLKYYNSISSNRWLILKIFMVLITFLLIFVLFIA